MGINTNGHRRRFTNTTEIDTSLLDITSSLDLEVDGARCFCSSILSLLNFLSTDGDESSKTNQLTCGSSISMMYNLMNNRMDV